MEVDVAADVIAARDGFGFGFGFMGVGRPGVLLRVIAALSPKLLLAAAGCVGRRALAYGEIMGS